MSRVNLLESLSDNIVIDKEKCTFCGLCVETCVLDNLRLKLAPCRQACPLGLNCQGYIQLIARGREETLAMVREKLPFAGILGRICAQPCESACHHAKIDGQPLAIRALKRYLVEAAGFGPAPLPSKAAPGGAEVAVVGSGPAGLMAAHDLAVAGHRV
ncbi:MAG: 4Fe-4S binding protein [Deltaproteobacteria bacterium]|nr:4Fe-4S binding protein [Deltaproteobacteria bacterium]